MKKLHFLIAACLVVGASAFTVSTLWNVADGVTISYEMTGNGTKGTLSGLKATIDFNAKDPSASKIEASLDASSLTTDNEKKTEHLKSADFFDVAKHPTIKFTSKSITTTKDGFLAKGDLMMKDSTHPVEIPFTFTEDASGGVFKGSLSIQSGDYGVTKKSPEGKDKVNITINVPVKK